MFRFISWLIFHGSCDPLFLSHSSFKSRQPSRCFQELVWWRQVPVSQFQTASRRSLSDAYVSSGRKLGHTRSPLSCSDPHGHLEVTDSSIFLMCLLSPQCSVIALATLQMRFRSIPGKVLVHSGFGLAKKRFVSPR